MTRLHMASLVLIAALAAGAPSAPGGAVEQISSALAKFTAEGQNAYMNRQYDVAERAYLQAASLAEKHSPQAAIVVLSNLGSVYREQKKYEAAEETFKKALTIAEKHHLQNQSTLTLMKQYGLMLRKSGRNAEADHIDLLASGGRLANFVAVRRAPAAVPRAEMSEDSEPEAKISGKRLGDFTLDELKLYVQKDPSDLIVWRALARKYVLNQEYGQAISVYEDIAHRFPDFEDGLPFLGSVYIKSGQHQKAFEVFQRQIQKFPGDADSYLSLMTLSLRLGQLDKQIEVGREFVARFPQHSQWSRVKDTVEHYQDEYKRTQARVQGQTKDSRGWPRNLMPLKVFVHRKDEEHKLANSGTASDVTEQDAAAIIDRAINEWTQAAGGQISFAYVNSPQQANVEFRWTDDSSVLHSSFAAGETSFSRGKAIVNMMVVDQDGNLRTKEQFYCTCLHELGHALGLSHSNQPDDVMYFSGSIVPKSSLSGNDRERIVQLYNKQ